MPDSSDLDAALLKRLTDDPQLKTIVPDGVYFDQAPQGKTKFVVVSLVDEVDAGVFGDPGKRRSTEDTTYAVKAVTLGSSGTEVKAAAARIDLLLEDQPLTAIPGYVCLSIARTGRIRHTEVDSLDQSIRWQHRGGRYRVLAAPLTT